jgi:pimeloyl-ACP methyl ester carboxylesterase
MAEFVLVHGSGQHAGCWSRVRDALSARGHAVETPELPKHAPDQGLMDHAARIAASITSPRTVVVAHSFSGVFLPLVPRARECGLLVYLAAVIPEPGKSVRDQLTEDPGMFVPGWLEAGARWFDASQQESIARNFLFHDCDERTLPWALETVGIFDTRHMATEPSPLGEWPAVPSACIVASEDRTLSPDWCRRMSRRLLGQDALEVQSGHCPMVSRPTELADQLEQLAELPDGFNLPDGSSVADLP